MADEKKPRARRRTKEEMAAARAATGAASPGAQTAPGEAPTPGADAAAVAVSGLINALEWIDMAQSDDNLRPVYETHCLVMDGWLLAYNGVITAGHSCPLSGFYAPNTSRFLAAMTRAGKGLSITGEAMTAEGGSLTVAGKSFRARVPVLPGGQVAVPYPEQPQFAADDRLAQAIEAVLPITKAGGDTVLESSIMLTPYGTVIGATRQVALEAFHGIQIPAEIIIPRQMATLMKGKTGLYGVGFGNGSVTFWYGPEKFLRCQLHEREQWPPNANLAEIFHDPGVQRVEVPKSLAFAADAVEAHTTDGAVYFNEGAVLSARTKAEAEAYYDCDGLPAGLRSYNARNLAYLTKHASTIGWLDDRALIWTKHKDTDVRGVIVARNL